MFWTFFSQVCKKLSFLKHPKVFFSESALLFPDFFFENFKYHIKLAKKMLRITNFEV